MLVTCDGWAEQCRILQQAENRVNIRNIPPGDDAPSCRQHHGARRSPVKIDSIDVYHVAHPMREAWTTAYGSDEAVQGLLVRMTSGEHSGWGKSNPFEFPTYTPEYAAGAFATVAHVFAPLVVGREMETASDVLAALAEFRGNNFAKAAIEIAWWALRSEISGQPLHALLGGTAGDVSVGEAFGITGDLNELLSRIQRAFDAGYRRIKLKVRPERDLEMLQEIRRAFPKGRFHIDGNCGYTLRDLPKFEQIGQARTGHDRATPWLRGSGRSRETAARDCHPDLPRRELRVGRRRARPSSPARARS
jgi:hypothetical protein